MVRPNSICKECNKPFYASPSHLKNGWGKFCSQKCSSTGKNNHRFIENDVACKACGKIYHQKPSKVALGRAKVYCSNECRAAKTRAIATCIACGKKTEMAASRVETYKYCSDHCRHSMTLNKSFNRTCATCEKPFYTKPSELKRGRCIGTFCSVSCMNGSRGKKILSDGIAGSYLEKALLLIIKTEKLDIGMVREFRFHPIRKWRFDFAWPEQKIAVEVQGGIWLGKSGAHTSGKGRTRDIEKSNMAAKMGWRMLQIAPEHIKNGDALMWIKGILEMVNEK